MPTIFAIDGAEDYFGDFGAYSSGVASLQTALITLGQKVGDSTLATLVLDGLIGPKTTAAANRAFTTYVSSGPNFASGGAMSQSQVASAAEELAGFVRAEISRRGGTANSATAPVRVPGVATPTALSPYAPSSAAAISDTSERIVKWAAIGLGGVVVASLLYYVYRRTQGRPAFGSAHSELLAQIEDVKQDLKDCRRQHANTKPGSLAARNLASRCRRLTIGLDWLKREERGSQRWRGGGGVFSGLGALPERDARTLEAMMDRSGGVADVFDTISEIARGRRSTSKPTGRTRGSRASGMASRGGWTSLRRRRKASR
jgi:hypothetical protein